MRLRPLFLCGLFVIFGACDEAAPCVPCANCVSLEGSYDLFFADRSLPAGCQSLGVRLPETELTVIQVGPTVTWLTTGESGADLNGPLCESGLFSALGQRDADEVSPLQRISLSGTLFGADAGTADGGQPPMDGGVGPDTLTGTYTSTATDGIDRCTLVRGFTAFRL
jgi:hypothetical protein